MCLDWFVYASSVLGMSSGLNVLSKLREINLEAYISCESIILFVYLKGSHTQIQIINTYSPYKCRSRSTSITKHLERFRVNAHLAG